MEKPSAREIWEIDETVIDLLVHDSQADRAPEEIQAGQRPSRAQLLCSIDPCTRLIVACWLSYEEEEMKSEH
jgi:hypothetical protein